MDVVSLKLIGLGLAVSFVMVVVTMSLSGATESKTESERQTLLQEGNSTGLVITGFEDGGENIGQSVFIKDIHDLRYPDLYQNYSQQEATASSLPIIY